MTEEQIRSVILAWYGVDEYTDRIWQVFLDEMSRRGERLDSMRAAALRIGKVLGI